MVCTSVRKLARRGYDLQGSSIQSASVLLRQFHHQCDGERTGNCRGGERRICMEVKRVVSTHINPEMVTFLTRSRSTSKMDSIALFSLPTGHCV